MGNSPVLYLRFPEDLKPLASEDTHSHMYIPTPRHIHPTATPTQFKNELKVKYPSNQTHYLLFNIALHISVLD